MLNARLTVIDESGKRVYQIDKPIFTIGRRSASDLRPDPNRHPDVSKDHAEIVHDDDRYLLRDRGSTFGTFVNGERIAEHTLVRGDRIRLSRPGGVELIFDAEGAGDSALSLSQTGTLDFRLMAAIMDGLRALSSGRVLDDVLTLVIDSALDTTRAERGFIMLANEQGELEFRITRGRGGLTLDRSFATSVKIPREVFASGLPKVVDDLDLPPGDDNSMIAFGIRRVLCVPLRVTPMMTRAADVPTGRVIGVLYLDQTSPGRAQSSALLRSVEAFATQAALAIDSARLYAEAAEKARVDRDLRVAAEIQRSLLAQPSYAGAACELAAISVPCRTIGGDFYDYLETEDGRLAFALGDVAGKGPPAALLAAALQSNFAAYASFGSDAARTTAAVNAALLRRPIEARFATMFHGVLTRDGQLSYCNGGHDLPFVLGADGVRWLDKGGPVLGLFKDAVYLSETIQLSENDLIVICSDGVTEAVNRNGEEFSRDRVVAAVTACPDRKAETVLDQLVATVREFSGGTPQADDMTVMVLRVGPHGAASTPQTP